MSDGRERKGSDSNGKSGPKALEVVKEKGETDAAAMARAALRPTIGAAQTVVNFNVLGRGAVEIPALVDELARQCEQVNKGDLRRAEAMLVAQAHSLDALFNALVYRSAVNLGEYVDAAERFMRLALKAQSQCRATLETLGALKNPPVVYARQANIAHGPQQVNNGGDAEPRAREIENEPNKLLEQDHGQRLDPGAASKAIGSDTEVAAVGGFDRTKVYPR